MAHMRAGVILANFIPKPRCQQNSFASLFLRENSYEISRSGNSLLWNFGTSISKRGLVGKFAGLRSTRIIGGRFDSVSVFLQFSLFQMQFSCFCYITHGSILYSINLVLGKERLDSLLYGNKYFFVRSGIVSFFVCVPGGREQTTK